jgi:hypothetical protein
MTAGGGLAPAPGARRADLPAHLPRRLLRRRRGRRLRAARPRRRRLLVLAGLLPGRLGSFGFQAGIQDSQTLLLLMNDRALNALMDSQFKVGADASLAIANVGGSVEAGATTALGADILAFSRSRGLFAGLALEGSVLTAQSEWNRAYYGREVSPRDIVVAMNAHNPGADPLRAALLRFGQGAGQGSRGAGAARPASEIEPIASPPSGGAVIPAAPTRAGRATGAVGRQALPPPPR